MIRVLALDMGTRTGWCLLASGIRDSGVQTFDVKRGESPGMRFVRFVKWLEEVALGPDGPRIDLIVFEQAHHRGGFATAVGIGFASHLLSFCARYGIDHQPVHTATVKKSATGRGNADKDQMVAAVLRHYFTDDDRPVNITHDEADAIAILEYARAELIPKRELEP